MENVVKEYTNGNKTVKIIREFGSYAIYKYECGEMISKKTSSTLLGAYIKFENTIK